MTRVWISAGFSEPFCLICGRKHCSGIGSTFDHEPDMDSVELGGDNIYKCDYCGKTIQPKFRQEEIEFHDEVGPGQYSVRKQIEYVQDEPVIGVYDCYFEEGTDLTPEEEENVHFHPECFRELKKELVKRLNEFG